MQKKNDPQPLTLGVNQRKVWRAQVLSQKKEPQILHLSLPRKVPTMKQYVTGKLEDRGIEQTGPWVLFPYANENATRLSDAVAEWIHACGQYDDFHADWVFLEPGVLCLNYTPIDGLPPPDEWEE